MATTTYVTDINWIPDPNYVNSMQGIVYLAWRIGEDKTNGTATWLMAQVRFDDDYELMMGYGDGSSAPSFYSMMPDPIDVLPPEDSSQEIVLTEDVQSLGQDRTVQPNVAISDVQAAFEEEVAKTILAVELGYR